MSEQIHAGPSASWEDVARVRQEVIERLRADHEAELAALRAERDKLLGCRDELREIAEAINDPRIHNTMTIAEWCREASWMKGERHELQRYGIEWTGPSTPICVEKADGYWTPWHVAQTELTALRIENEALRAAGEAALRTLDNVRVFVVSRERIHRPSGEDWFDGCVKALRAALGD